MREHPRIITIIGVSILVLACILAIETGALLYFDSRNVTLTLRRSDRSAKVALLFLVRGPLPLEPVWSKFLGSVQAAPSWKDLFVIVVHTHPNYTFPGGGASGSLIAPRDAIPRADRVAVEWGQHSVVSLCWAICIFTLWMTF